MFRVYLDNLVVLFIDDILVYYKNEAKHRELLNMILGKIKESKLYAKLCKCGLWLKKVKFPRQVIYSEDVETEAS